MDTTLRREPNGYGEKFLLKKYREIETDRSHDSDSQKKYEEKRRDYGQQLESVTQAAAEVETLLESEHIQEPLAISFLQTELSNLKHQESQLNQDIEYCGKCMEAIEFQQREFKKIQDTLFDIGLLKDRRIRRNKYES